jgi:poly-gamma-glutamate synthesis protein (capsule biosynthesis protein)
MPQHITVAATGDALIARRLPHYRDERFQGLLELLGSVDVAFTNFETVISRYRGSPVVESGGGNQSADPTVARDLQRMGFNLTAFANNHTLNYGEEGCLATIEALQALEFVFAGAGRNLFEARMPAFLDTPAGRVGLMACCSTFAPGHRAGTQNGAVSGRPGLNPQRFDTLYVVDHEHLDAIRRIAEHTGAERKREYGVWSGWTAPPKREGEFHFAGRSFIAGDAFGIRTEPHAGDLRGNIRSIEQARLVSDLVLASIHAHEEGSERWLPADFIVTFAHACIDAGADMVIGHGPHLLRGLEIYKGKPIFYSLGDFIFEFEMLERLPADDYEAFDADPELSPSEVFRKLQGDDSRGFPADRLFWESVLPICRYEGRELREMRLHPIELGFGNPLPNRGTPRLTERTQGEEILDWLAELSAPYGTEISIAGGIGTVRL